MAGLSASQNAEPFVGNLPIQEPCGPVPPGSGEGEQRVFAPLVLDLEARNPRKPAFLWVAVLKATATLQFGRSNHQKPGFFQGILGGFGPKPQNLPFLWGLSILESQTIKNTLLPRFSGPNPRKMHFCEA